jgi:RimJ/RimL family protein N-acetyltransferase
MQIESRTHIGRLLRLEPISPDQRASVRRAADDPAIWRFLPTRGDGPYFDTYFDGLLAWHGEKSWVVHTVRRLSDNAVIGQTCYLNIDSGNRRVEIGGTWYVAAARGTAINPECKLLLLRAAFAAGARRVELKTDARNAASRAAILKLGAMEEGTLRRHTQMWNGHVRDTVYFSILDDEWPTVQARLEDRLERLATQPHS